MFEIGRRYHRRSELHQVYGGQQQGGISTPKSCGLVFLFTGAAGEQFGYRDGLQPDGTFLYTGEGQRGDMRFDRGNKAILEHASDGKELHLFRNAEKGFVEYEGQVAYVSHELVDHRPDGEGRPRTAIVFRLKFVRFNGE
jgi:5-methylcytosine-specific restriction protein A